MATTVYNFLSPDLTEVEEQRIISAPGATPGDVLTVAANGTVSPAPGGGSQTVKVVDLGVIDLASVFTNGPQDLYAMQPGEFLASIRFTDTDYVIPDVSRFQGGGGYGSLAIGTKKSFGWAGFANSYHLEDLGHFTDTVGLQVLAFDTNDQAYGPDLGAFEHLSMILSAAAGGPVQAAWTSLGGSGSSPPGDWAYAPIGAWQAATDYALATIWPAVDDTPQLAAIVANDTVWVNSGAAGTSDSSEPDFAGNVGGTVTDGPDIVWTDTTTPPPTVGAVHAVAEIWTPA